MASLRKRKEQLDEVLEDLVGYKVSVKYVSSASEENVVNGILEVVNQDIIQIKEPLMETVTWINRKTASLTSVQLLEKKRKKRKK